MNQFKSYLQRFVHDESGMELLQLAIVVVITVGLIGAVLVLKNIIDKNIRGAAKDADNQFKSITNNISK